MANDVQLANDTWLRYVYVRDRGHEDYVCKARTCEDYFAGLQWDPTDLALLRAQKRPALTINKIISTLSLVLGEQIFNRVQIGFQPRSSKASADVADALTKVFMQIAESNQLEWLRSDVFADGVITSRGFYDVRLGFDDNLQGQVEITQLNPKNVLIDPDADEYDPDKWGDVMISKWLTPDDIALLYSKDAAKTLQVRQDSYFPYGYDSIMDFNRDRFGTDDRAGFYGTNPPSGDNIARSIRVIERQYKKLTNAKHFVHPTTMEMREVPEDWDRDQIAQYMIQNPGIAIINKQIKKIRWTVVADNIVLHDDWSPYRHYTTVPFFPYFRRGRTVGLVENLLGPQELLNKVSSQELHVVNTTANSGWKVKTGALRNMTIEELEQRGAQTGLVLELDDIKDGADKITPNQIPTGLDRISGKAEEHIKTVSGISDHFSGFAREDVSARALEANKKAGSQGLAKVLDNLNRTDWLLGRAILDCVQEFYTEERLMFITKDRFTGEQEEVIINQVTPEGRIVNDLTLGEYAVVVSTEPERDTFEDSQFDQAVQLRKDLGVQIPDSVLIESSRMRRKHEISRALQAQNDTPEAQFTKNLAMRKQAAEVADLESNAAKNRADAAWKVAKAQRDIAEINNGGDNNAIPEAMIDAQVKKYEIDQKMRLEREKFAQEMELERFKTQQEMEIKRSAEAQKVLIARAQAAKATANPQGATQ